METASVVVRAGLFLVSLAALAGSAVELAVSTRLESDFEANQAYCRLFLCDERTVANYAYKQQIQGDSASVRAAVEILRGVSLRDPASAERWIDLGEALEAAGSAKEARFCIARALELGDTSADVLIPAGNFYLNSADRLKGIRYLSRALSLTPAFDGAIFSYFGAHEVQVPELLKDGVLDHKRIAQAYLRYSIGERQLPNAQVAWHWIDANHFTDQPLTIEYVNFLIAQTRFNEAAQVWTTQYGYNVPGYARSEYLYNGDFDAEPIAGAFFDWKITPSNNVETVRDLLGAAWSLRIRFDGTTNLDFRHVSQKTVLPPGRYRFRARVRTEAITTDQGIFFRIADGEAPNRLNLETPPLAGTSEWREIESTFAVGPGTRFVEVSVNRRPSIRFDNKINGTIWIEGLSLARI